MFNLPHLQSAVNRHICSETAPLATRLQSAEEKLRERVNAIFERAEKRYGSRTDFQGAKENSLTFLAEGASRRAEVLKPLAEDFPLFFVQTDFRALYEQRFVALMKSESAALNGRINRELNGALSSSATKIDALAQEIFYVEEPEKLFKRIEEALKAPEARRTRAERMHLLAIQTLLQGQSGFGKHLLETTPLDQEASFEIQAETVVEKILKWCSRTEIEKALESVSSTRVEEVPLIVETYGTAGPWMASDVILSAGVTIQVREYAIPVVVKFESSALDLFRGLGGDFRKLEKNVSGVSSFSDRDRICKTHWYGWKYRTSCEIPCKRGSSFQFYSSSGLVNKGTHFELSFDRFEQHK